MNKIKLYGNLLCSDYYKVGKLKSIIVAPIVMTLLILFNYSLLWIQADTLAGAEIPEGMLDYLYTGKSMLFSASSYINLGLFIAIICGIFIGGEFKDGTLNTVIARGADRVAVYFSKWLTMVTLSVGFVLGSFLVCGILSAITGYGYAFTGTEFALLLRSLVLQLLVAVASTSVYVCIAFLARSQGATIGISLAMYFLISIIAAIFTVISQLTDAEWLSYAASYFPSQQLTTACSSGELTTRQILEVVFVPLAYIAASIGLGLGTFCKRDIK